jgi:sodium transport system permease protein
MSVFRSVLVKELREVSRDWKALVVTYGMPLVVYPILFVWMAEATAIQKEKEKVERYSYARLGPQSREVDRVFAQLERFDESRLDPAASRTLEKQASDWVRAKAADRENLEIVLRGELLGQNIQNLLVTSREPGQPGVKLRVYFDPTDNRSSRAADLMIKRVDEVGEEVFRARLAARKIPFGELYPVRAERALLSGRFRTAVPLFGPVVLSLMIVLLSLAAYYPALGATVTERENGTLATLLSAPARESDLVLGKFVAVWLSSILGLLSYAIPAILFLIASGAARLGFERTLLEQAPWVVAEVIGLSFLLSAISLALGFLARKQSVAQGLLSVLILSSLLPVMLVNSGDIQAGPGAALVPFMNLAVISKMLFVHPIGAWTWFAALASNVAAGVLMLAFCCHLLENEVRGDPALVRWRKAGASWIREPTADLALIYYALALGLGLYVGVALTGVNPVLMLYAHQLLFVLGIPIALSRAFKLSAIETFQLRPAPGRLAPACVFLAFALAALVGTVITYVHIPQSMAQELERQIGLANASVPFMIAIAVPPTLCEELAFRGFILSGLLRRFSPTVSVVLSSLMFAFMHVSLVRFIPTLVAGLALGYVAYRTRSIWPGVLVHALYNLTIVLFSQSGPGAEVAPAGALAVLGSSVAVALGIAWITLLTRPAAPRASRQSPPVRLAS